MSTIDDLLSRHRRGPLSEADERRLHMAVQTSREHQLALLAGKVFERAGAPQSGDAALVKSIVRQVEGEWSGTFQRVVARRRLSRWVSVPALIAGVAAASWGGYRLLRGPAENPRALAVVARAESRVLEATPEANVEQPAAPTETGFAKAGPGLTQPSLTRPQASEPEPARAAVVANSELATPRAATPSDTPVPTVPAAADTAATADTAAAADTAASAAAPVAAALPAVAPRAWRLPRPKRHLEPGLAEADRDVELGASGARLAGPVAGTAAGGVRLEPSPDLESAGALFRRANQLRRSDWDAAAALYERLALRHSESREAGVAEMALGKHALGEGRARQALQWFEAYQRRTGGELAAEAVWGEARALESLGENQRARELWRSLVEQYPSSAYAAAARVQLGP